MQQKVRIYSAIVWEMRCELQLDEDTRKYLQTSGTPITLCQDTFRRTDFELTITCDEVNQHYNIELEVKPHKTSNPSSLKHAESIWSTVDDQEDEISLTNRELTEVHSIYELNSPTEDHEAIDIRIQIRKTVAASVNAIPPAPKSWVSDYLFNSHDSDITIVVGERSFPAHKFILKATSPYFRSMFESNMREADASKITIAEQDPDEFASLLEYLYTGTFPWNYDIHNEDDIYNHDDNSSDEISESVYVESAMKEAISIYKVSDKNLVEGLKKLAEARMYEILFHYPTHRTQLLEQIKTQFVTSPIVWAK
eukprot:TRINITY_DN16114_c0_g1::TRINITY_DN16114_c0_g1_i1::g.13818::m.13818 TRINITY_DN16114_c0_g1::TRINITY_DN16114_c0_g1_i1::g.13818  ORF type:complete len:323 (-),score=29.97,sp/A0JMG1/SPOLB_DANRE/28.40/8e-12,BTB/PF00651.26/5.1e-21 TRINITY_DN16114_c0_g1_i1:4-933(-)